MVEVIIAFAMLAIVLVSFLGLFTAGHWFVFKGGAVSGQVFEAHAELDKELAHDDGDLTAPDTPTVTFTDAGGTTLFTLPMTHYLRAVDGERVLEVYLPEGY